jgi:hypothetical protein
VLSPATTVFATVAKLVEALKRCIPEGTENGERKKEALRLAHELLRGVLAIIIRLFDTPDPLTIRASDFSITLHRRCKPVASAQWHRCLLAGR